MEALKMANLVLEGFCVILCVVIAIFVYHDGNKSESRRWYGRIAISNICLLIGDMCDWAFSGKPGTTYHYIMVAGIFWFYLSASFILLCGAGYFFQVFEEREFHIFRHAKIIAYGLCYLQTAFIIISVFNGMVFYIDENNIYQNGSFRFLGSISYIVFGVFAYMMLENRKKINVKDLMLMLSFIIIPVIAEYIQSNVYGFALLCPSITLAIIVGLMFIQIEEQNRANLEKNEDLAKRNAALSEISQQQDSFVSEIINVLGRSIEAKDVYTQGHSARVANYTKEMIYRLGGSEEEQIQAYYVGLLHDIGKLRIPDTIINKKGKLSDEEYEMIKVHTVAGYHILREIKSMPEIYEGARWHHERYDGKGYPNGLAGEEIPYLARVIAVADAYDAMTSMRSYHDVMPQSKVREEIEKGKGVQFDPKVADVMLKMIDEDVEYDMRQLISLDNMRILLVDDDNVVHTSVKLALEDERYQITSSFGGEEAISIMQEEEFDMVLLDLQMPGMDGLQVAEWIQKNRRKIKTILFTGDKEMSIIRRAMELGIRDYVTKPIRPTVLKESIKSVLMH